MQHGDRVELGGAGLDDRQAGARRRAGGGQQYARTACPQFVGEFQQAVERRGRNALDVAYLAYAYAVAGQGSEAQRLLVELEGRSRREHVPPTVLAMVYMGVGQDERAFDYLDRAVAEHDGWIAESIFYPTFDPLRSHPRYAALLEALGLK